jgi:hypothetical protein
LNFGGKKHFWFFGGKNIFECWSTYIYHGNPRSYARRSMFERKGYSFQLISILFCKVKRVLETLKNDSFEVNYVVYGGDRPIFYKVFYPQYICRTSANIFVQVLRFLWSTYT